MWASSPPRSGDTRISVLCRSNCSKPTQKRMGPATIQRRKTGCWTCRLRRKRCSEGGPPCINCVNRQVYCHGYGPKPEWKDKGEKERQEAVRLQLRTPNAPRRRISSVTHSNPHVPSTLADTSDTSASSMDAGSLISPPLERALSTCSTDVGIDLSLDVDLDRILFGEEWSTFEHHEVNTLPVESVSLLTPVTPNLRSSFTNCEPHLTHQSSEREMDLVMYYLDHLFSQAQGPHLNQSRGWLLSALMASPGFYYAAIGTSAYCQHRDAQVDSGLRATAYHDYQCYRTRSSQIFSEGSWGNVPGEALICAVHLCRLETLSGDTLKAQQYFKSALTAMSGLESTKNSQQAMPVPLVSSTISPHSVGPHLSLQTSKAMAYSQCLLAWTDILTCSVQGVLPDNMELYNRLLSDDNFCSMFRIATGCASWVPKVIMACSSLAEWKKDQERQNGLSIRALVSRCDDISSLIERELHPDTKHSHIDVHAGELTSIYGHAALVYLNVVVSGANTRVPEISHSVNRAMKAWSSAAQKTKTGSLLWPSLMVGSLAEGSQRELLEDMLREPTGQVGSTITPVTQHHIYSMLQKFWQALDRDHGECDWKSFLDKHSIDLVLT